MLPEYASKGHGEGFMHDTAMLLGALGWSAYDGQVEVVTPYFGASGTGPDQRRLPGHAAGRPRGADRPRHRRPAATASSAALTRITRDDRDGPAMTLNRAIAMPHLVILYTPQLDAETDMPALCRTLADTMLGVRDEARQAGVPDRRRARAGLPAPRISAVADGDSSDYAFAYLNLRMARGRSESRAAEAPARRCLRWRRRISRRCWRDATSA